MDIHGVYTEVLVRWMERINAGLPPIINGDGAQTMDFVDIADIARANILAAESDVTDEVFNIARGEETSLLELAQGMITAMGADLDVEFGPARAQGAVTRRLADTSKAREMLGFEAEIDLQQGLRNLVDWWRSERAPEADAVAVAS